MKYMKFNDNKFIKGSIKKTIFDFSVLDSSGNNVNLKTYSDNNPILIVNVASY